MVSIPKKEDQHETCITIKKTTISKNKPNKMGENYDLQRFTIEYENYISQAEWCVWQIQPK